MNMSSPFIALTLIAGMAAVTIWDDGTAWPVVAIVLGSAVVTSVIMYVFYRVVSSDAERASWRKLSFREKMRVMSDNGDIR
jgi:hypothetical protein